MNGMHIIFRADRLSISVAVFVAFFSVLIVCYSLGAMRGKTRLGLYYGCVLITFLGSLGAVFADNLVLFIVFWGFLGIPLYLLIGMGEAERASYTAKKTFILIGGTDCFMLLGLAILWQLAGHPGLAQFRMSGIALPLTSTAAIMAYLCLLSGTLAKAGALPFHTWVPDASEDTHASVAAFLPAALDKLLGIYFLMRLTLEIFHMTPAMNTFLMALGSITIIAAVMMALVQHDLKRLLGYHAVSQVGYMILGIGTGSVLGIAGGLFHMLNNTLYKSCLFLAGGAVEQRAGTTDLGRLGGYAKAMPITFGTFLIASLAIAGVPPFNGFASKWMIYQGILDNGQYGGGLWVVWLAAAMAGSALTLASFMKLIHAVFLGQPSTQAAQLPGDSRESGPAMLTPMVILAALCVVFGVLAYSIPLRLVVFPSIHAHPEFLGLWRPVAATFLLLLGLGAGVVIYWLGAAMKTRETKPFVGGETLADFSAMRVSGTEFYKTVQDMPFLNTVYRLAEKKAFDVYDVGAKLTFSFSRVLGACHSGELPRYLAWCLAGTLIVLYLLMR